MSTRHRPITRPVIGQELNVIHNRIDELERLLSVMGVGGGGVGSAGSQPPITPPLIPCPNGPSDCPAGYDCIDGVCKKQCTVNGDCSDCGGVCNAGHCDCPDFSIACPTIDMVFSSAGGEVVTAAITLTSLLNFAGTVALALQDNCDPECFSAYGTAFLMNTSVALSAGGTGTALIQLQNVLAQTGKTFKLTVVATSAGIIHTCIITVTIVACSTVSAMAWAYTSSITDGGIICQVVEYDGAVCTGTNRVLATGVIPSPGQKGVPLEFSPQSGKTYRVTFNNGSSTPATCDVLASNGCGSITVAGGASSGGPGCFSAASFTIRRPLNYNRAGGACSCDFGGCAC